MSTLITNIQDAANRMRISAIKQTATANSGHPSSSVSAAEIVATLFFAEMKFYVSNPKHPASDRFVLSKGHGCPILYAAWEEAGLLTPQQLRAFRQLYSELEGHPTPRLNFVDVATGSLGQGLSCAAGMAYVGKYFDKASYRVYCLLGDGETAEGAVWEAAAFASYYKLDNLLAIVDVNRLGQSQETQIGHDLEKYAIRFNAFGWHTISVDGHSIKELIEAYNQAKQEKNRPTIILAKTFKGRGIIGVEDLDNFHGKPVDIEKTDSIFQQLQEKTINKWVIPKPIHDIPDIDLDIGSMQLLPPPEYNKNDKIATREAYGNGLYKLAKNYKRIIALDGDMSNSTFSNIVKKNLPDQFIECFIAEQNMVGVGVGLSCRSRAIPFVSTFSAFLGRAFDQIRMSAISFSNIKYVGSHCGISIGEDGPSQMALEDLAAFRSVPNAVVLYPTDAVAAEKSTELAANHKGIVYIRLSRPALPVIYDNTAHFAIGKSKIVRQTNKDCVLIVAGGVTLYEALKADDVLAAEGYHSTILDIFCIKPIDKETLLTLADQVCGRVITVEDHYEAGGIGEAVVAALSEMDRLCIRRLFIKTIPRSGKPNELLDYYQISTKHIIKTVKAFF